MRHIFLVNSFSLKQRTSEMINRINAYAKRENLDYLIEVNDINNSTEDILKKYKKSENIIYAIGGDGVINRVVNKIAGTKNILSFIPCGTGNDFYSTSKELLNNGINEVDLIKINDSYMINLACFGIDAEIGNNDDIVHSRLIPKSQRYNASVIAHFAKYKPRKFTVLTGKDVYDGYYSTVCVCNARYYGGGFRMNPDGLVNDGLFDLVIVDKTTKFNLAKFILRTKKGKHVHMKEYHHIRTDSAVIKCENKVSANVDGEKLTSKVFKIKVCKEKMRVYCDFKMIDELRRI